MPHFLYHDFDKLELEMYPKENKPQTYTFIARDSN